MLERRDGVMQGGGTLTISDSVSAQILWVVLYHGGRREVCVGVGQPATLAG